VNSRYACRIAAGCVAAVAWTGLAVQIAVSFHLSGSVSATLWIVFAYFTIWTNLLVAVVFTALATNLTPLRSNWIVAGTMLSILLVGAIYALLLHGLTELSGGSAVANVLLHMATPILVPLFCIFFAPKGDLTHRDPLRWAVYPLAYLAYALARETATGQYPYPFLNVVRLGWQQTFINSVLIAAGFLLAGLAIVWIDNRIDRHPPAPPN